MIDQDVSGERSHASFFSGVGGLDLGLERAGWRTVSFSEIDPYASAVLAERWPGVPNLGDIVRLAARALGDGDERGVHAEHLGVEGARPLHVDADELGSGLRDAPDGRGESGDGIGDESGQPRWRSAALWTGGFPCQDLSVAGKRRGMVEGTRSNLAFTFLGLVERYRPPAVLLENVPGLLSSHGGRDMARLLGEMAELGYGVAYRVLDARHFGVPQRRRRVFILGLRSEANDPSGRVAAERAAAVLAVGSRCDRHPPTGVETGQGTAEGVGDGAVGTFTAGAHPGSYNGQDAYTGHLIPSASPDAGRDGAPHGLAGRSHDRGELVGPILAGGTGGQRTTDLNTPLAPFVKRGRAQSADDPESWGAGDVMPTLNSFDVGDARTTAAIIGGTPEDDPLLPLGLDSHRYRCCGNGVVAPVAEWIGRRLLSE